MSLTSILAWTLLHFVWQGTLLAAGLGVLLAAMRGRGAHARYRAGVATMFLMVVAPVVTATRLARPAPERAGAPNASVLDAVEVAPIADRGPRPVASSDVAGAAQPTADASAPLGLSIPPALADRATAWTEAAAPVLVAAWLAGVLLLSVRFGGGWLRVRRMTREHARPASQRDSDRLRTLARRLGIVTTVRLLESALVEVPTVIGWLRPVVLVPLSLGTGLSPRDLELLLAHELAHIRRQDYLLNLLQTVVETVLFYHPGVWWVSRQVREEREHCCDDIAVALCDDRAAYATALLRLEELRQEAPRLAVASTGGNLLRRIRRLVVVPTHHADTRTHWAAIPLGAAALAGLGGWVTSPALVAPVVVSSPVAAIAKASHDEDRAPVVPAAQQLRGGAPDTVIRSSTSGSLEERWAWAEGAARRRGSRAFWIGYSIAGDASRGLRYIDHRVPVYANGSVSMGSMRLKGPASGLTFQGVRLDSLLGPGEPEDQAIFLGFVARNGRFELDRIHASAYILPGYFAGRTLYWIGRGADDESVALVRRQFDASTDREHRHDLVNIVGMHLDGAVVMQTFRSWLSGDQSEDVRTEVAEELGNVMTPEALNLAARLARGDRSRNVQREAAEAIGEMEVAGA
ncbi:MAG: HEAT repeat domain-containing protein, partial [Cytophagaceae bacterium]|nr:HEAT repeat domain-containing protein [Gemmatimonadaceae bacterium]